MRKTETREAEERVTRIRTCARRGRPSAPVTLRLTIDRIDEIDRIARDTGEPNAAVLEKLVLYALTHVKLRDVTRKELTFQDRDEENET